MSRPVAIHGEDDQQWSSNGPSDRCSITTNTLMASSAPSADFLDAKQRASGEQERIEEEKI